MMLKESELVIEMLIIISAYELYVVTLVIFFGVVMAKNSVAAMVTEIT